MKEWNLKTYVPVLSVKRARFAVQQISCVAITTTLQASFVERYAQPVIRTWERMKGICAIP